MKTIRRGDIFWVKNKSKGVGCEQKFNRPAIIVSNDKNNTFSSTVEVVFLTTKRKTFLPTHTVIDSCYFRSVVLCEQVTTIDKMRLSTYVGTCSAKEMKAIDRAISISLGLDPASFG